MLSQLFFFELLFFTDLPTLLASRLLIKHIPHGFFDHILLIIANPSSQLLHIALLSFDLTSQRGDNEGWIVSHRALSRKSSKYCVRKRRLDRRWWSIIVLLTASSCLLLLRRNSFLALSAFFEPIVL